MSMTAASPEVAIEALWRCIEVSGETRRAAVKAVLDEHWAAIQAHFAAAGDDLTSHDRAWYVDHFASNLSEYVPKEMLKKKAKLTAEQIEQFRAAQAARVKQMEADQAMHYRATRTPRSKWKELGLYDPFEERHQSRKTDPPSVPAAATAEGKAGKGVDHQVDGQAKAVPKTAGEYRNRLVATIVGQEPACRAMALAMVDHGKGCTLLVGPSGTGKTLIAETAAAMAGRPFVSADASQIVPAGLVGETIGRVIGRVRAAAEAMGTDTSRAVLLLDEIDKLLIRGTSGSQMGPEVIGQLLRILDGATVEGVSTEHWTIILCGAWSSLRATVTNPGVDDLSLPTELAGRIRRVARLNPHTTETLSQILRNERISPWGPLLGRVADDGHAAVIAEALRKGTGARGLRFVTTAVTDHLAFMDGGEAVQITAAVVAEALAAR